MAVQSIRNEIPSARWLDAKSFASDDFTWKPGRILLGKAGKDRRLIGFDDNRHVVTIAGSRAGKSSTSLIPNLLTWPGSTLVIDPKGELATHTAMIRAHHHKQDVCILDPFGEVKGDAAAFRVGFNPLDELAVLHEDDHIDDAALLAEALVVANSDKGHDHWTLSAQILIQGLILWQLAQRSGRTMIDLRNDLSRKQRPDIGDDEADTLLGLFTAMGKSDAYDGVLANVGLSFEAKPEDELGSIISTALSQIAFLSSTRLRDTLNQSQVSLRALKERRTTIYLVLPASRMATQYKFLRMVIILAMAAMERTQNQTDLPVLFMLEEFPTLGYMRPLEAAAGLMAGYDVKLWTVMQDLSQIKALYPNSWETFMGNAGVIEAFGNADLTTSEYLSKRIGNTLAIRVERNDRSLQGVAAGEKATREQQQMVPLLAPFEVTQGFSRDSNRKLVLIPEKPPFPVERLHWKELMRNADSG